MTITESSSTTIFSELKSRIDKRQARVAIMGLGYVGLPLALLYSEQKFPVTGFDIDQRKVSTLTQGGSYIFRIAATRSRQARARGFEATTDYSRLTEMDADHHLRAHAAERISRARSQLTSLTRRKPSLRICAPVIWWYWRAQPIPGRPKKS